MKLIKHCTKYFFTDLSTGKEYCVMFIDFEHRSDGYSILIQEMIQDQKTRPGSPGSQHLARITKDQPAGHQAWKNIDTSDTEKNPSVQLAEQFLKLALK